MFSPDVCSVFAFLIRFQPLLFIIPSLDGYMQELLLKVAKKICKIGKMWRTKSTRNEQNGKGLPTLFCKLLNFVRENPVSKVSDRSNDNILRDGNGPGPGFDFFGFPLQKNPLYKSRLAKLING